MNRVSIVLPGGVGFPTGGSRMALRYGNAMAALGWNVVMVLPSGVASAGKVRAAGRRIRYLLGKLDRSYDPRRWLKVDARVRIMWVPDLGSKHAPMSDVVIATAVQTAEAVARWPAAAGRKFYFVQGYETWDLPEDRVHASWRLPLQKFAVSRWLCELIEQAGSTAEYLPNGLDHAGFGLDRPARGRVPLRILWPHHWARFKGSADVVEALRGMEAITPDVELCSFGTCPAPHAAGRPICYARNPAQADLRALYNSSAIFIAPSHSEGWGLPACEAMQCGCAVIASDIGGHREFLRDGVNGMSYPPGDSAALRRCVLALLADVNLRERLAQAGIETAAGMRFEPAVGRLQAILSTRTP